MRLISTAVFVLCAVALAFVSWRIRRRHPEATSDELFDRLLADRTVRVAVVVI